jgi:hypothetical protein
MSEIGPALRLMEVTEFEEENQMTWTLVQDQTTIIFVDLDPEIPSFMTLSAEVAAVPDSPLRAYETVMTFNTQFFQTGGGRMGTDEPGGKFVLMQPFETAELSLQTMTEHFTQFVDKVEAWREIISKFEANDNSFDPSEFENIIRV